MIWEIIKTGFLISLFLGVYCLFLCLMNELVEWVTRNKIPFWVVTSALILFLSFSLSILINIF